MGDIHFSQGDGEISFCGAIEMSGFLVLKTDIIRGGMKKYLTPMGPTPLHVNPIFEVSPIDGSRWFSEWLVFEGLSIDENGTQHFLDASIAFKRAVLNAIDYLAKFGYSMLLSLLYYGLKNLAFPLPCILFCFFSTPVNPLSLHPSPSHTHHIYILTLRYDTKSNPPIDSPNNLNSPSCCSCCIMVLPPHLPSFLHPFLSPSPSLPLSTPTPLPSSFSLIYIVVGFDVGNVT